VENCEVLHIEKEVFDFRVSAADGTTVTAPPAACRAASAVDPLSDTVFAADSSSFC
jgi:hypothetical protein